MSKTLAVFVEGSDDARFVEKIFRPRLKKSIYSTLLPAIEYARLPDKEVNDMAASFNASQNFFDYVFLADRDNHKNITACHSYICKKYPAIQPEKIVMVCAEIESWYFAGLAPKKKSDLGIRRHDETDTDLLTKEEFNKFIPPHFQTDRRLFLIKILEIFSVSCAKKRNSSFRNFCSSYQSIISSN